MHQLLQEVEAEGQWSGPEGAEVLQGEEAEKRRPPPHRRGVRHPLPAHLKIETITIEPPLRACPACGKLPCRIGEEVSEEIDSVPPPDPPPHRPSQVRLPLRRGGGGRRAAAATPDPPK